MDQIHKKAIRASYISIFGNAALAIIKGITGYFGNSYALIADAIESTSDVFSSSLVLVGLKVSKKPADEAHPYGHGKAEPLVTFLVVGFLFASAVIISIQSIENIITPHKTPQAYTLIILGAIIIVKETFYQIINRKSYETKSTSLKADAWHHRSDAITSLTAFVGISIALLMGDGYETADDWAALLACTVIIYNGYRIFRPALGEIMDEQSHGDMVLEIRKLSKKIPGVIDIEKCFIRKSGMQYHIDLHLTVSGSVSVKKGHQIAHDLKDHLMKKIPQLVDVLIHVEPDAF